MAGIRALRKIQLGRETTPGTKIAADIIWRGTGSIHDNMDLVFPTEDIGMLVPVGRSYISRYEAGLTLNETEATFEQLPHLFEMGIESVTPTPTGTSDYTYTYIMPYASTDLVSSTDLATYTVEGGDNAAEEEFGYAFARSISLTGSAGQALMMSAEIVGRQVEAGTFTPGIAIADVEEILFGMGKLYISDVKAFPATDLISNQLLGMSLSIKTGWLPLYTADGALYFSFIKQTTPEVTLQITFEHDTTAVAEKAAWRAQTPRIIRLIFTGTDGKELAIDIAGKWQSFDVLGEQDGNDIVSGTFRGTYNSTVGGMFQVAITNLLSKLP